MKPYRDITVVAFLIAVMVTSTAAWYISSLTYKETNPYAINFVDTGFVVVQSNWVYSGKSNVILTITLRNNTTEVQTADLEIQPLDVNGSIIQNNGENMTQYATTGDVAPGDTWTQDFLFQKNGLRLELNVFQIIITGEDTLIEGDKISTFNIEQEIYTSGGGTSLPIRVLLGYRSKTVDGEKYPKYRYYDELWSNETEIISPAEDKIREVRVEFNPNPFFNDRAIMVVLTQEGYLEAYDYDSFSWGSPTILGRLWVSEPLYPTRPFDIAYEKNSGHAIVVYSNALNNNGYTELAYRTWDGYTWSQEYYIDDPKSDTASSGINYEWIRLSMDPTEGSDKIGFAAFDSGWMEYSLAMWNGSSWTDWNRVNRSPGIDDGECFDIAWEYTSGQCMAVVSEGPNISYYIWNGSWSSYPAFPLTSQGSNSWTWLRLKPHNVEGSDRMMLLALDSEGRYAAAIDWDGDSWNGQGTILDDHLESSWGRCIDGDWEPTGTKFLVAAGDRNVDPISIKTWTPSGGWSHPQNVWAQYPTGISNDQIWIQVDANPKGDAPLMTISWIDVRNDLGVAEWNGTALLNFMKFTKRAWREHECYDVAYSWR